MLAIVVPALLGYLGFHFKIISDFWILIYIGLAIFIGSILPDIDTRGSKIVHIVVGVGLISILALINKHIINFYLNKPTSIRDLIFVDLMVFFLLVVWFLPKLGVQHRGIVHSYIMNLILPLPFIMLGIIPYLFAVIAFFSHLLIDNFTGSPKTLKIWK